MAASTSINIILKFTDKLLFEDDDHVLCYLD